MSEPKTWCPRCGARILQATFDRNGGLCTPCKKGWSRIPPLQDYPRPDPLGLSPPVYDIDEFHPSLWRDVDDQRTIDFALGLWGKIDKDARGIHRIDGVLLGPEIVVRDLCMYDTSMGNGFSCQLGYSAGLHVFARGLRSMQTIGAKERLALMQIVAGVLDRLGVVLPASPLDPYETDEEIEPEVVDAMRHETSNLDTQYWNCREDPYLLLLHYLLRNRSLLLSRKQS